MTRENFINWINNSAFSKRSVADDFHWEWEVNYSPRRTWDVYINEDNVEFHYEDLHWGYTDFVTKEFSFEDFVKQYVNDTLTDY